MKHRDKLSWSLGSWGDSRAEQLVLLLAVEGERLFRLAPRWKLRRKRHKEHLVRMETNFIIAWRICECVIAWLRDFFIRIVGLNMCVCDLCPEASFSLLCVCVRVRATEDRLVVKCVANDDTSLVCGKWRSGCAISRFRRRALLGCYPALSGGYRRFGTTCRPRLQASSSPASCFNVGFSILLDL